MYTYMLISDRTKFHLNCLDPTLYECTLDIECVSNHAAYLKQVKCIAMCTFIIFTENGTYNSPNRIICMQTMSTERFRVYTFCIYNL